MYAHALTAPLLDRDRLRCVLGWHVEVSVPVSRSSPSSVPRKHELVWQSAWVSFLPYCSMSLLP